MQQLLRISIDILAKIDLMYQEGITVSQVPFSLSDIQIYCHFIAKMETQLFLVVLAQVHLPTCVSLGVSYLGSGMVICIM